MIYGYARCSTNESKQDINRQIKELKAAGADEVITFSHTAYSKAVFGKGAVQAAKFLAGKPAGLYNMSHVIDAQM